MQLEYTVYARRIGIVLGIISLYFAAQSLLMEYLIENVLDKEVHATQILLMDLFSVNAEETIPTWYATLLLFAASVVLGCIAAVKHTHQEQDNRHWIGLAVIFLYLSIDEGAVIHEIAADIVQENLNVTGYLAFGWHLVALPLLIIFALLYGRFLFRLPSRTRWLFILAGCIYIGGAFIVEAVSANQWYLDEGISFQYLAIATLEEVCEMLGVVIFIYALLDYAALMNYSFLLQTRSSSSITDSKPASSTFSTRRLLTVLGVCIIVLNAGVVLWAFNQEKTPGSPQETPPYIHSAIDQFVTNDVVLARFGGSFGGDNLTARQMADALLNIYDEVMVITLASTESSLILAGQNLTFDRDSLSEVLRANGETEFIIFETPAVKLLVGDLQP